MRLARNPSKYQNKKVEIDGYTFDSRAEGRRYEDLKMLMRSGLIRDLELQPSYELAPSVHFGKSPRAKPPLRYVADFRYVYVQTGEVVIEDVKGVQTEALRIKLHLMKSVHGLDVTIVGRAR